jgi:ATP-dependent RNA helicase RhlE
MLDMGFLPDIRNIIKCLMNKHQTLLFSATMPADIRNLIKEITHAPITVQIGQSAPANTVSHAIYPVAHQMKTELLIELLKQIETESVLVFTRTKHSTERITRQLQRKGFKVASLQGNLSQNRRQYALDGFRRGSFKILVATDLAARGIDISTISHVINYDMPESIDAYIHRIGRTGRVDKSGDALTFVTPSDTVMIRSLERILKTKLERRIVPDLKYSIPDINSDVKKSRARFRPQRRRFPNRERKNNRVKSVVPA